MDIEIRTISDEEFTAYARAVEVAFSDEPSEDDLRRERELAELDRCFAAFDGPEIVGTAAAFTMPMAVPGAEIDVGYVTAVGVKPTHRRRGVNTELMRRQLEDAHDRGELVDVLYASEGGIYGRYGYGLAALGMSIDVESARTAFVRGYEPSGTIRLLDRDPAIPRVLEVHDAVRPTRPGMVRLDARRLEYGLHEHGPDAEAPKFFAVHEGELGIDGYAIYRVKHDWPRGVPRSVLTVRDLQAITPGAGADLWRFVFDIDLTEHVQAWSRPVDDPLLHLVREPRRLEATIRDNLWLRPVDVAGALAARRYAAGGRIVLEVRDDFCSWNDGRFALETSPGSAAEVARVREEPDMMCSVNDVGAAYLAGTSFRQLHRAGRVRERTPDALAVADAMFGWDPAPWCPYVF
ncbi:MAG TPA: GNAT family N-acetyltransferase [Actinomycetota bacterium]